MSLPVQISDLPVANSAVDGDLMILRKGLTDYQINVSIIRNLDLSILDSIPTPAATDLMYIQRGSNRYSVRFSQVGFLAATKMWFYNAVAPAGWTVVAGTGDRILGVADGSNNYDGVGGGGQSGTWQQPNWTLTVAQIPPHRHRLALGSNDANANTNNVQGVITPSGASATTSDGGTNPSDPLLGQPHNHGNTYRPLANVGIICNKDN